jgi:tetratricopeptide (TPR) repeat protein
MRIFPCNLRRSGALAALLATFATLPLTASCHAPEALVASSSGTPPSRQNGAVSSAPFAFPDVPAAAAQARQPPMSLTASDGSGLHLTALTARAVVEGPLSFTEMHLTFDNPEDRVIEGNFSITLPAGASIGRFAMKLGDVWQEGEVVEKKAAREAYEDFLHRKQDPALLEQAAGNEFSARVFPIPARGRKELILSYSQELTRDTPYTIPLRGLPELGLLDIAVMRAGDPKPMAELSRATFVPDADFRLDAKAAVTPIGGLRSGNLVVARVHPIAKAEPDPLGATLVLLDTSASRALGFDDEIALAKRLAERIAEVSGPKTRLAVACYDQVTHLIFEGEAGAFGEREIKRIRERQALGASNLGQALAWAGERAKEQGARRVVILTDGVPTAGETEGAKLREAAAKLQSAGVERLDAVALGGIRDEPLLRRLVTAGLAHDGVVVDGAKDFASIERRLTEATKSGVEVKVAGALWSYPQKLDGVQAGDEVLVYADVPADKPVKISVGGVEETGLELLPVERALLERSLVQAKIASLLERQGIEGDKGEIQKQIVALSVGYRVLSPYTGLLVLETERDYARFNIDRESAADILSVDRGKIAIARRAALQVAAPTPEAPTVISLKKSKPKPGRPLGARGARDLANELDRAAASVGPRAAPKAAVSRADAPTAPWGGDTLGNDPLSARGNMWGSSIPDAAGEGGLGLSGIGEGGGGRGEGIGLGSVGTIGHGAGVGAGPSAAPSPDGMVGLPQGGGASQGFGSGHGRLGGSHATSPPTVRMGASQVSGRIAPEVISRVVRQRFGAMRACYEAGLARNPALAGRVAIRFVIDRTGSVSAANLEGSSLVDAQVNACIVREFRGLSFPTPEGGVITVTYPLVFSNGGDDPAPLPAAPPPPASAPVAVRGSADHPDPYAGRFKDVMDTLATSTARAAIEQAYRWHREEPGDVMALTALGQTLEAAGELATAARAYGSIIDLFPARADLRRFAGERLEHLKDAAAADLALDTFARARDERADHPASHRLLAFAELRRGHYQEAFTATFEGLKQPYPSGRFRGVDQILREDLGLVAAAWIKADPKRREEILAKVAAAGGVVEDTPSLRFVLNWETDANDVDFHIFDADGGHAFYEHPELASGGRLYADVTTGYGPECFTIRLPREQRSPLYTLQAHYYSRGPMGYGMGKLEIIDHDGSGGLTFEERPFVAMVDHAFVELGTVTGGGGATVPAVGSSPATKF